MPLLLLLLLLLLLMLLLLLLPLLPLLPAAAAALCCYRYRYRLACSLPFVAFFARLACALAHSRHVHLLSSLETP